MRQSMFLVTSVAVIAELFGSSQPRAQTETVNQIIETEVCPGHAYHAVNNEGTLFIWLQDEVPLVAKVLPEGSENELINGSFGSGFVPPLNPTLKYKVSIEAIAAMKSTLDAAAMDDRKVLVIHDSQPRLYAYDKQTRFRQIWNVTGPLSKSNSLDCAQKSQ